MLSVLNASRPTLKLLQRRRRLYQPKDTDFSRVKPLGLNLYPQSKRDPTREVGRGGEPAQEVLADPPTSSGAEPGETTVRYGGRKRCNLVTDGYFYLR